VSSRPGTITDADLLEAKRDSLLVAVNPGRHRTGHRVAQPRVGTVHPDGSPAADTPGALERLDVAELLVPDGAQTSHANRSAPTRALPAWQFDAAAATKALSKHFGTRDLAAFGVEDRDLATGAAGALLGYAASTQQSALAHVRTLGVETASEYLALDAATRRNLEITQTLRGETAPTLLSLLDECGTAAGSRLLRHWLTHPLRSQGAAAARHAAVAAWKDDGAARRSLAEVLSRTADVERIAARIALGSARPRDLAALRDTLRRVPAIAKALERVEAPLVASLALALAVDPKWSELLASAIAAEPAAQVRDGGVIAAGFDAELDDLRAVDANCGEFLVALEARERARTGIANLKVEYNRVHGFYIEVTHAHVEKIPDDYRRRQTLKNAERYVTPELKTFEDRALSAQDRALAREKVLYERLVADLAPAIPALQSAGAALAAIDVLTTFAERAETLDFACPELVAFTGLAIRGGRHPVVERQVDAFIANDLDVSPERRLLVITGPNMGGKSTYMRQAAVIALLACCGSFVPARSASIGPLDAIHTRIGAADDLAGGRSTFMVEMTEAAAILHRATAQSLVADRRDRPRNLDVRRAGARLGDRAGTGGEEPEPCALRNALLRAHGVAGRDRRLRQPALRRGRACGRHRFPARRRGWSCQPQLRPAGGEARRRSFGGNPARSCISRAPRQVQRAGHPAMRSFRAPRRATRSATIRKAVTGCAEPCGAARGARSGRDDPARRAGRVVRAPKAVGVLAGREGKQYEGINQLFVGFAVFGIARK
jgi:DNA mismatch repair protein MutS